MLNNCIAILMLGILLTPLTSCKPRDRQQTSKLKSPTELPCPEEESGSSPGYCKWNQELATWERDINNIFAFDIPWNPSDVQAYGSWVFSAPHVLTINHQFSRLYQETCTSASQEYVESGHDEDGQPIYEINCPSNATRNNFNSLMDALRSQSGFQIYLAARRVEVDYNNYRVTDNDDSLKQVMALKSESFYVKKYDDHNFKFGFANRLETHDFNGFGHQDAHDLCRLVMEHEGRDEYVCSLILTNATKDFFDSDAQVTSAGVGDDTYTTTLSERFGSHIASQMQDSSASYEVFIPLVYPPDPERFTAPAEDTLPSPPQLKNSYVHPNDWKADQICGFAQNMDFPNTFIEFFRNNNRHIIDLIEAKDRFTYNAFYILDWIKDTSNIDPSDKTFDQLGTYNRDHPFMQFVKSQADSGGISLTPEAYAELFSYADNGDIRGPNNMREIAEALCIDENIWNNSPVWIHEGTSNVWYADPAEWASTLLTGPAHSGFKALGSLVGKKIIGGQTVRSASAATRRFIPTKQVQPQQYVRAYPTIRRLVDSIPGVNFLANRFIRRYEVPLPNANRPLKSLVNASQLPDEAYNILLNRLTDDIVGRFNSHVGANYTKDQLISLLNDDFMKLAKKIEYVDFDLFEMKIWEATETAVKTIVDEGKIPIFVAQSNKYKSNYWVWTIIEEFLSAFDPDLAKIVLWLDEYDRISQEGLRALVPDLNQIDNYVFVFMDDGVYSGSQLSSSMGSFMERISGFADSQLPRLNLFNITPFQTDYSVTLFFQKFSRYLDTRSLDKINNVNYFTHLNVDLGPLGLNPKLTKQHIPNMEGVIGKISSVTELADDIPLLIQFNQFINPHENLSKKAILIFQHKIADHVSLFRSFLGKVFPEYFVKGGQAVRPPYK